MMTKLIDLPIKNVGESTAVSLIEFEKQFIKVFGKPKESNEQEREKSA